MQLPGDGRPPFKPNQNTQSFPSALSLKWRWSWGWLGNVFLQPHLYLPSPRHSCQLQEPSCETSIHVALETSLKMMVASSLYTLSSQEPTQVSFRDAQNPLSHCTNHHLHLALPHCLKLPQCLSCLIPHLPEGEERAMSMRQQAWPPHVLLLELCSRARCRDRKVTRQKEFNRLHRKGSSLVPNAWKKNTILFTFFFPGHPTDKIFWAKSHFQEYKKK